MANLASVVIFILIVLNFSFLVKAQPDPVIAEDNSWNLAPYDFAKFTIIVLPDTQYYSANYPDVFGNQTQWIIENKETLNIIFVTHLGDIVDHWWTPEEWHNANVSMSKLDGNLPYGVLPGNHDGAEPGDDFILYNMYFGFSRYINKDWYGGAYQNINTNNYQLFSGGGDDYLIFHLQNDPPNEVLTWAGNILDQYPSRKVIISTHNYIYWDRSGAPRSDIGDKIWERLVEPNAEQVFLVLSGHYERERRRVDVVRNNEVIQMISDYQDRSPYGGNGYLRIMTFSPNLDNIFVQTYSPYLNKYETGSESKFNLSYNMTSEQSNVTIVSNSSVMDLYFDPFQDSIEFVVSGEINTTGYCNVTIPKELIENNPLNVSVNDVGHSFLLTENATHNFAFFTYSQNSVIPVTIRGTPIVVPPDLIPEFPSWIMMPLFVTATLIGILVRKKLKK